TRSRSSSASITAGSRRCESTAEPTTSSSTRTASSTSTWRGCTSRTNTRSSPAPTIGPTGTSTCARHSRSTSATSACISDLCALSCRVGTAHQDFASGGRAAPRPFPKPRTRRWEVQRTVLRELSVQNLALIEDVHVELQGGYCAWTGETGAGKSLLLTALGLVLGGKASADFVRAGKGEARAA